MRSAVAVTATIAAVLGATGSAVADSATASPTTTSPTTSSTSGTAKAHTGPAAKSLCKRVPKIDARIDRALARLNGPATERGSIARLQKRVDTATTKGQTAVEKYLNDRLTFRKSLVPTLTQRSSDLDGVRSWCDSLGDSGTAATK